MITNDLSFPHISWDAAMGGVLPLSSSTTRVGFMGFISKRGGFVLVALLLGGAMVLLHSCVPGQNVSSINDEGNDAQMGLVHHVHERTEQRFRRKRSSSLSLARRRSGHLWMKILVKMPNETGVFTRVRGRCA